MCGFASIFHSDGKPIDSKALARMAATMVHRGPDDAGLETVSTQGSNRSANLGFAFRRLAIIDLSSAGHQPMASDDGDIMLVFNGEIYNAPVHRLGIKPLYYAHYGASLIAASEIKAIVSVPEVKRAFDPVGVADYMRFQFCLGEETLFDGIKLLSPGTMLTYDASKQGLHWVRERFWQWRSRPNHARSLADTAHELRHTIEEALRRQTRSDVPVGTFLSSGMDTGAIAALATRQIPNLHSFTCGFDTAGIAGDEVFSDERGDSEQLAKRLGTMHHVLTLGASAMPDYFTRTIWHMESPQVGISYQILAMAEAIRPHVTVVLSGTGGDELFAGYQWRYQPLIAEKDMQTLDNKLYQQWCRLLSDDACHTLLTKDYSVSSRARFQALMSECDSDEPLDRMLHVERLGFLHGLLQVDDKLNMAASVESRVPLLDNEVIDLAETIPAFMKYDGQTGKIILKEALKGLLPDEVINRRKQGFTPPDAHHLRASNHRWATERLTSESFRSMGMFEDGAAEKILAEHRSGAQNHRFLIWAMLCLHGVQELYMEKL